MARPLRIWYPGAWYHVTARGNERREIYRSEEDRLLFLARLSQIAERFGMVLHGYVMMENHFHLIVEPREDNLSRAMQWLNVSYSQWFNRRHQRSGHLFQGRFKSVVIDWQAWGLELSRYVHLNPVRTGQEELDKQARQRNRAGVGRVVSPDTAKGRIKALRIYRWSSFRAYIGLEHTPKWLCCDQVLGMMGGNKSERPRAYQRLVEAALLEGMESPWDYLTGQVILGDEAYVKRLDDGLIGDEREQAPLKQLRRRPNWEQAVRVVERLKGEAWAEFRDRHGDWGRDVALWLGRMQCRMTLKELAEAVEVNHYASVGAAIKLLEKHSGIDSSLARLMTKAKNLLNNEM